MSRTSEPPHNSEATTLLDQHGHNRDRETCSREGVLQSRVLRFFLVGGVSTGLSYGLYALLMFAGVNYAIANLGALVAGILFNFKTQGAFVFGNSDNRLLWRFAAWWLAIYVLNVSLIGEFIALGIDKFVAGLLPIPWTTALSYFMQRFLVFGRAPGIALQPPDGFTRRRGV